MPSSRKAYSASVLPRALGGEQVSLQAFVEVIEEVARHGGSAAWNLLICSLGGAFADYLPEPAAREIYADGGVAVGSFALSRGSGLRQKPSVCEQSMP